MSSNQLSAETVFHIKKKKSLKIRVQADFPIARLIT